MNRIYDRMIDFLVSRLSVSGRLRSYSHEISSIELENGPAKGLRFRFLGSEFGVHGVFEFMLPFRDYMIIHIDEQDMLRLARCISEAYQRVASEKDHKTSASNLFES